MSTEWGLTLGVLACTGLIITRMAMGTAGAESQGAGNQSWKWDASHRCRLVLVGTQTAEGITRISIGNDAVFPVRYRLVVTQGPPLVIEAWPKTVTEVVLPASVATGEIHVPDCRRRL